MAAARSVGSCSRDEDATAAARRLRTAGDGEADRPSRGVDDAVDAAASDDDGEANRRADGKRGWGPPRRASTAADADVAARRCARSDSKSDRSTAATFTDRARATWAAVADRGTPPPGRPPAAAAAAAAAVAAAAAP